METDDSGILDDLERDAGGVTDFRSDSFKVGSVYTMNYSRAVVAIYDFDRESAGGLPKGGFLIATKKEGGDRFILLRILKEAKLPNAISNDQIRQQGVESTVNKNSWAEALDPWLRTQVSLHGIECRILGTFMVDDNNEYRYAEDTDNYYSVTDLLVYKPDQKTLNLIVNYRHRKNSVLLDSMPTKVGQTKFAAAEGDDSVKADILLNPTDLLQRRTVYLGMSRSGKSNAMKITADRIYRLRKENSEHRIGQLIFDPNGEYAQDNPQDGYGLHKIHESLGLPRDGEVETYGLFKPPTDPERTIMKLNFFGNQFPDTWETEGVEMALEQMLAGYEIVKGIMASETARYTTAFRDADLSVPHNVEGSKSAQIRYKRAVLAYRTTLVSAGLDPPNRNTNIKWLFGNDILEAMKEENNKGNEHCSDYHQAALILERSKSQNSYRITWDELVTVFSALNRFIADKKSYYSDFENNYTENISSTNESWADPRLKSLLRIFERQNGPRLLQKVREQHDPNSSNDFAMKVVDDLKAGKLVIIDQSTGDPEQNRKAAERIMWKVFQSQQEAFRSAATGIDDTNKTHHILVYVEEAHNLLPRANAADNLRTVWARSAKEGSKMNIGMVLATQAPSSIMPEILSETDNWILAYLNSENERRVIAGYMDFGDFLEQIGQVSEAGFVRLRTLSLAYTVPMKFDKFELELSST